MELVQVRCWWLKADLPQSEVLTMKRILLLVAVIGITAFTLGCPRNNTTEPPKPKPPAVDTTRGASPGGVTKPEPPKEGTGKVELPKVEPKPK
jgi:hypothetical protein